MEKSMESVSRGAEHTKVREHLRIYKDDIANFSNKTSISVKRFYYNHNNRNNHANGRDFIDYAVKFF
ncbi:MAG: palindromic element RPE5 domain-containing protein [Rickettsia endosymbiont of Graphium doson]|nr:palindromic element RPE5 domain-containing protein [Rickettsia endosymbiont of Graphium doson]